MNTAAITRFRWGRHCFTVLLALASVPLLLAAPFSKVIKFTQPDGTVIQLHGEGDEFHAVFETLSGFTVVFDEALQGYCYASLASDGDELLSTGVLVGGTLQPPAGLTPHLRLNADAVRQQIAERFAKWDAAMEVTRRWRLLKAEAMAAQAGAIREGPPSTTTLGNKMGFTLLIDFTNDVATVPQVEIINFCNGDNYTGDGNACSVKKYFSDMSNGRLTYSNFVTVYIRVPMGKDYYNDTRADAGQQANYLIDDALDVLLADTNYLAQIMPALDALTVDNQNQVVAFNVFYAGDNGGRWSYGLWPHSWALVITGQRTLPNGKRLFRYQITNIGSELSIGTFCHENGHMLCGYPDLYDYTYNSTGVGDYCLMGYGGSGKNPTSISAYLKRASGWASTIELTSSDSYLATVGTTGTNYNVFFRYGRPGVSTEYFLFENRQKQNHDASLPGSGVLVWHIDELGDNSSVNLNTNRIHNNFEATVVQADNLWDLERNRNYGNATDLYYSGNTATGYRNELTDTSRPNARWWDGTFSGFQLRGFTSASPMMNVYVGTAVPVITQQPTNRVHVTGDTAVFAVAAVGAPQLAYQWRKGGAPIPTGTGATYAIANVQLSDAGTYSVQVYNSYGTVTSSNVTLSIAPRIPIILTQPAGVAALVGTSARFTVEAFGGPPLSYQWRFNGQNIAGATRSSYTVSPVTEGSSGTYSVRVINPYGSVTSDSAVLSALLLASLGDNSFGQFNVALGTTNVVAIAAGAWHNLALRADGGVTAWGHNWNGQCDIPAQASDILGIAAGGYHSLALNSHGKVIGWGSDDYGQATAPSGLVNVRAISAGTWHSLALRTDGTVVAWGDNSWGQCGVPTGLRNVIAIAAGGGHSLALRNDGTVVAWGQNTDALGLYVGQAYVPWGLKNVKSIAAGEYHSAALTSDGQVVVWGDNSQGQSQVPANLGTVSLLTAGGGHTVALRPNGTVVAWGNNDRGQCSFPSSITNAVSVSAGQAHSLVLVGLPNAPIVALRPSWSAGTFSLVVQTVPGKNYALEYRNALSAGGWTSLPAAQGNGALQVFSDPAAAVPGRFYRVRQW